jgi:hypothetical protein
MQKNPKILQHLKLAADPPPIASARVRQTAFAWSSARAWCVTDPSPLSGLVGATQPLCGPPSKVFPLPTCGEGWLSYVLPALPMPPAAARVLHPLHWQHPALPVHPRVHQSLDSHPSAGHPRVPERLKWSPQAFSQLPRLAA